MRHEGRMRRSWEILGRITSIAVTAGGWLLAGVRWALDLIGYATAPEDAEVAGSLVHKFAVWILSIPWWATWALALILTASLMWFSWPRSSNPVKTEEGQETPNEASDAMSVVTIAPEVQQQLDYFRQREEFHAQWRQAQVRREDLEAFKKRLKSFCEIHDREKQRLYQVVHEGNFDPGILSDWTRYFNDAIHSLETVRSEINGYYFDLFGKYVDFEATPLLQKNPFSVTPSNLDRLHTDAQKHDYRRAHEQAERFSGLIKKIEKEVTADLSAQSRIIRSGAESA
jgi:hypothetical protein